MGLIKPENIAKDSEESHQTALFAWANSVLNQYPELAWLHHIPNGGSRGSNARDAAIAGAKMKAQGVKPGVADLFLPVRSMGMFGQPLSGLYIEMKAPKERPMTAGSKGGMSDKQIEFCQFAANNGFAVHVCYSWTEAKEVIEKYLKFKL